jgi:hypothetical protein
LQKAELFPYYSSLSEYQGGNGGFRTSGISWISMRFHGFYWDFMDFMRFSGFHLDIKSYFFKEKKKQDS